MHEQERGMFSLSLVEAFAVRRGVEFCQELGFQKIILGDIEVVIKSIQIDEENLQNNGQAIRFTFKSAAKTLKKATDQNIGFTFKEGKKVGDRLAKKAIEVEGLSCWIEDDLTDALDLILDDKLYNP